MSIEEIKNYMRRQNITYQELSNKSNVPLNTLKNIFRGKTVNPRIDTMNAIESALGLNGTSWTAEEIAQGVTPTIRISVTTDEDDILYIYRLIGIKLGEAGQKAFKEMGETLLKINNKK